jgi:dipeptide/tripeptide permease
VFAASGSVPGTVAVVLLVGGMALLTAGELWISAAGWSVRYGLAKPHRQGEYGAVFSLGSSAMDMIGPAVVVILTDQYGLEGWAAIAALYALLFVAIRPAVAWAGARQA